MPVPTSHPPIRPSRSALGTAFDVVARVGTAVTLAALLVVVGTVLATIHAAPAPTGAAVTDH
jgi:hypothetical protein